MIFNQSYYNLEDKIESSKKILNQALSEYKPHCTIVAFSGGDDSLCVMEVLKYLNHKPQYAIFANTGTCIPATKTFVETYCKTNGIELLTTSPKKTLREMVIKEGFPGLGKSAHNYSFGELKGKPIRDMISAKIRQGKRHRNVIVFSGIRRNESEERSRSNKYKSPFWQQKTRIGSDGEQRYVPNIWTSLIHQWEKEDTLEFLESVKQDRNPISILLGRSGDCHCGTAIANPQKEFSELNKHAQSVAKEISELNQYCIEKRLTQWAEKRKKSSFLEKQGQCNLFEGLDLCRGCKNKYILENKRTK